MLFGHLLRGLTGGWSRARAGRVSSARRHGSRAFAQAIECLEERQLLAAAAPMEFATHIPAPINNGMTVVSPITVQGVSGRLTDVNVSVSLVHPYPYDLSLTLITPGMHRILLSNFLFSNVGTTQVNITFDDEGGFLTPGVEAPAMELAIAVGEDPNGLWQLEITDAAGFSSDNGALANWSVIVTGGGTAGGGTFDTPVLIPDMETIQAPINVTGLAGEIFDVNVRVDITHMNSADLSAWLISPSGTRVQLFNGVPGSGSVQNFHNTRFDDAAPNWIFNGEAPYADVYRPSGLLSSFRNEDPNGMWMLEVQDNALFDLGILNNWTLSITTVPGYAEIHGNVWHDQNDNGVRDASILIGDNPHVVFAVDVSWYSEYPAFGVVGDQNNDGVPDTVLDAQIAGFKALVQHMVDRGWGDTGRISIVAYDRRGTLIDMNGVLPGVQATTTPLADANGNGIRDVDEILSSLVTTQGIAGYYTSYTAAFQQALGLLGTSGAEGNVIFLSGGEPDHGGAYDDEVADLRSLGVNVRAFGIGYYTSLNALQMIDPDARILDPADLIDTLGGVNSTQYREDGLPGIVVYLDLDGNGTHDEGEPFALTNADGDYAFYGLPAGIYTVRQRPIDGWAAPSPESHGVTLWAGRIQTDIDFGNQPMRGGVTGVAFIDNNGNGVYEPGIDTPLQGWLVYIDLNGDGVADANEPQTLTDASGAYVITGLLPDNYVLRAVAQGDLAPIVPGADTRQVAVPPGSTLGGQDFANVRSASIGGVIFQDNDGNGTWSRGEPMLASVFVYLDTNGNGQFDPGEPTAITDGGGAFQFTNLAAGTYIIRHIPRPGFSPSPGHSNFHVVTVVGGDNAQGFTLADTQPLPRADVRFVKNNARPSVAARTNFGSVAVDGGMVTRTFVIRNLGTAPLRLTGLPWINFKARRPSFLILRAPARVVAPGASTQLVVRFDPVSTGVHNATIMVPTNDPRIGMYRINVRGVGVEGTARARAATKAIAAAQPAAAKPQNVFSSERLIEDVLAGPRKA